MLNETFSVIFKHRVTMKDVSIFRLPILPLPLLRITLLTTTIITRRLPLVSDARPFITIISNICALSKRCPLALNVRDSIVIVLVCRIRGRPVLRKVAPRNERQWKRKILILKLWPNTKPWNGSSGWDIGVQNVKLDFPAPMP